jgi:SAM-dependent methyltransferase
MTSPVKPVRHYDAQYGRFSSDLYAAIRREAFGEDIGQNSWLTSDEHDLFIAWMSLTKDSRVLDVACGSGHTTLRIASRTGCSVHGVDIHENAIDEARGAAQERGFASRATFQLHDASKPLPFDDATFDALICIDAINHLPNRPVILGEWARVLKPEGVLVFTDPIVVSGALTAEEIAIRSSIGFFLFVPPGTDERLLEEAGFTVNEVVDRTGNMAKAARGRLIARHRHESALRQIEGDESFDGQQRFLEVAARLAEERRLSRLAFRATRR